MKILYLEWDSLGNAFMKKALEKKGYQYEVFPFPRGTEDTRMGKELTISITEKLLKGGYDYAFSFNYFPVIAIACKACKIPYVSWIYDSPFVQLYSETIKYDTNRVFIFDSSEYERLRALGVDTVHFLPMAAPVDYYRQLIDSVSSLDKYSCDIAFVGSTYTEKSHYKYHYLDKLDDYTKGYLEGAMNAQKKVYGYNFMEQVITPDILKNMQKVCPVFNSGDGFETPEWVFATYFLDQRITATERAEILDMLSKRYDVKLYTTEATPNLPHVTNMGEVNPYTEAPLCYAGAKINLNISLRSIVNGIPLRCFDIMGCGGFLMSSYQADFLSFFTPDEDFVYYDSYEDLMTKCDYYLSHEKERLEICENALEKVKKYHTYDVRIDEMFG